METAIYSTIVETEEMKDFHQISENGSWSKKDRQPEKC